MSTIKLFLNCLFSPKLYKIYTRRTEEVGYIENNLEKWGGQFINSILLMLNLGVYPSPIICYVLYRKGYSMYDGFVLISKFSIQIVTILVISYSLRTLGRMKNSTYIEFCQTLRNATKNLSSSNKKAISQYDFDFTAWPVEFSPNDVEGDSSKKGKSVQTKRSLSSYFYVPCSIISYIVAHTFGIRMIYPGSVSLVGYMMATILMKGRSKLVLQNEGERFKLKTVEGNQIDTIFVDNRKKSMNGQYLVICSEGNAGFYEIGIMCTPIEAEYSVLGWNHPGFGASTGMPYPDQEQNAMDIVMQFAIVRLGFTPDNIILFGWSIGGYTTSWAGMMYPDVKAVILDATFDDLLPLAIPRMPMTLEPIVKQTIRYHCNLDIASQLCQYPGPVLLIRRSEDEVICMQPGDISTNRANPLLEQLLRHRYPRLFTPATEKVLEDWLSETEPKHRYQFIELGVNGTSCKAELAAYYASHDHSFPTTLGDGLDDIRKEHLLLYLADAYMKDYKSSHCTQLPANMFLIPELMT